ncbi:MAG: hypothetical protein E2P02_16710 [Acidobacteria bacterium]|nr:MAG: hypothetical protein E2P02_16710 [Acidobacteriota bacterium]
MSASDLVRIEIEGSPFDVPKGEVLLACVQYIVRDEVPVLGRFCWSDECGNCEMRIAKEGMLLPTRARGCQTIVEEGMRVSELTPDLRYWIHHKLS